MSIFNLGKKNIKKEYLYNAGFKEALNSLGMWADIVKTKKGASADYIKAMEDVIVEVRSMNILL